jgi:hypothetical protein
MDPNLNRNPRTDSVQPDVTIQSTYLDDRDRHSDGAACNRTVGLANVGLATLAGDAVQAIPDDFYPRSFLIERTMLGIFLGERTTDFVL